MNEIDQLRLPQIPLRDPVPFDPPSSLSREDIGHWIIRTAGALGVTPTELAKAADLAASTINRFLREKDGSSLNTRTIDALVSAANRMDAEIRAGARPKPKAAAHQGYKIRVVPVIGRAQRALSAGSLDTTDRYEFSVPVREPFSSMPIGAFTVTDDHGGDEYPEGSIVITAPSNHPKHKQIDLKAGDHVVALEGYRNPDRDRNDDSGGDDLANDGLLRRITVRRVTESPDGDLWLMQLNRPSEDTAEDTLYRPLDYPLKLMRLTIFFHVHTVIKPK